jgi:hypothetical protein
MADKSKVAERFDKFIYEAAEKVKHLPLQNYKQYPPAERPPDPILKIYEACLSKLTDDELAKLDEIIEKMSGAV